MESDEPLVSIVTTCYNHAPFLDDYFRGLLEQTYSNVELIFLDDGSSDASWERATRYELDLRNKFRRVTMLTQQNAGMHAAVQRVVSLATGDLVCILESDDFYYKDKISENVRVLSANSEIGLVHSDLDYLFASDEQLVRNWKSSRCAAMPEGEVFRAQLVHNWISTCTSCVRRSLVERFARFPVYERRAYRMADAPLWLDICRHARVGYIPTSLACYRVRGDSAMQRGNPRENLKFFESTVKVAVDYVREYGVDLCSDVELRNDIRNRLFTAAYWLRESGAHFDAFRSALHAIWVTGGGAREIGFILKLVPHWAFRTVVSADDRFPNRTQAAGTAAKQHDELVAMQTRL